MTLPAYTPAPAPAPAPPASPGTAAKTSTKSASKSTTKSKSSGIDFSDAAEIYRRLGIAVNKAFINRWRGKVNSIYEFRDMMRWHDKTYRKSQEYKSGMNAMRSVAMAFFPNRGKAFAKILDTAVRRGWTREDLAYKLMGTKLGKQQYAGYKQFAAQEPGLGMTPVQAAMKYRELASYQRDIYRQLGLPEPDMQTRRTYFSNKVAYDQAAAIASDPNALRMVGSASRFAYGPTVQATDQQKELYDRIRRAMEVQKSYLASNRSQFQQQRSQTGEVVNPYLQ